MHLSGRGDIGDPTLTSAQRVRGRRGGRGPGRGSEWPRRPPAMWRRDAVLDGRWADPWGSGGHPRDPQPLEGGEKGRSPQQHTTRECARRRRPEDGLGESRRVGQTGGEGLTPSSLHFPHLPRFLPCAGIAITIRKINSHVRVGRCRQITHTRPSVGPPWHLVQTRHGIQCRRRGVRPPVLRPKQQLTTPTQRKKREKRVRPRSASGNVPRALCPPRRPPRLDCLRQPAAPGQHPAPGQRPAPGEPPAPGQAPPGTAPRGARRPGPTRRTAVAAAVGVGTGLPSSPECPVLTRPVELQDSSQSLRRPLPPGTPIPGLQRRPAGALETPSPDRTHPSPPPKLTRCVAPLRGVP